MKYGISISLAILSLYLMSCMNCAVKPEVVPKVSCDIAYQIDEIVIGPVFPPYADGNMLYLFNGDHHPDTMLAVEMDSGRVLWKTTPSQGMFEDVPNPMFGSEIFPMNGSLWVVYASADYYLAEIDPTNGACKKMVRIMNGAKRDLTLSATLAGYGSRLFYVNETGIACLDTAAVTIVDSGTKLYEAQATQAYTFPSEKTNGYMLQTSGKALICSYRQRDNYADTGILRIDMDTLEKRWDAKNDCCYRHFLIVGDALYAPVISYDDGTEANYAYRFRGYSLENGSRLGSFESGTLAEQWPVAYNDTIIQTATVNDPNPLVGKPMVFCLDASTLAVKWRVDFQGQQEWSGSNCQVWNGVVYQPHSSGIRLFDADTGELLGYDESIHASSGLNNTASFRYGDRLIVWDGYEGRLLGIRMNFKKTAAGLVKE